MRKLLLAAALCALLPAAAISQIPRQLSYQGFLTSSDVPVSDGAYDMSFLIHGESGAAWREDHLGVPVSGGVFDVILGETTPIDLPFDEPYDLDVKVEGEWVDLNSPLVGAPYCLNALRLEGLTSDGYLKRNVGETSQATTANHVLRLDNFGSGRGLIATSIHSQAVYGKTVAADAGVEGEGAGIGPGVRGWSVANHGVVGYSNVTDYAGVYGESVAHTGVRGSSTSGYGVWGSNTSTSEWTPAVFGKNEGLGDGTYGWSQNRHGIYGVTSSASDAHAGVYGVNNGAGPAVKSDGDLFVDGAYRGSLGLIGGAPFPRPAFVSGWTTVDPGDTATFDVGSLLPTTSYSRENFFVDVTIRTNSGMTLMSPPGYPDNYFWIEDDNDVGVHVDASDGWTQQVRVRVWYIQ